MPGHVFSLSSSRPLLPHMLAGTLALLYAYLLSNTSYVTTGVQFVSPFAGSNRGSR